MKKTKKIGLFFVVFFIIPLIIFCKNKYPKLIIKQDKFMKKKLNSEPDFNKKEPLEFNKKWIDATNSFEKVYESMWKDFNERGKKALNVDYINYGSVYLYHNKYGNSLNVFDKVNYKGGVYEIRELRSGRVGVGIDVSGYPSKWEEFYLKKGETKVVRFIADFTKGQVVRWRMIDKNTGKPYLMNVGILATSKNQKKIPKGALERPGYILWTFFPESGRYYIHYSFHRDHKFYDKYEYLTIKPGEKKYIEKKF